ncbi:helix-turn-helix domain-containing protein [Natronoarchaeum sp. GCM10025703]|uniref:helix-turn-helix domain-containing protein n=1 Tax=Natronoarchaeum sp. GCM10025321 TaxID=3252684 RepID=UPI0036112145
MNLCHLPDTTIQEVVETLDLPQRTVYEYVDNLEAAGLIEQSNEGRPAKYAACGIELRLVDGNAERLVSLWAGRNNPAAGRPLSASPSGSSPEALGLFRL